MRMNIEEKARRKRRKRAMRQAKKRARKEAYQQLSLKKKIFFWGIRGLPVLLLLVAVSFLVHFELGQREIDELYRLYDARYTERLDEERILEAAPVVDDGARVAALGKYDKEDTWAFYIYMTGSDLESYEVNELSMLERYLTFDEQNRIRAENHSANIAYLESFLEEMKQEGMDLPEYLYYPELVKDEGEQNVRESLDSATAPKGAATMDLEEMLAVELPKNVKFIIQTGGASRWSFTMANPNRSQRFLYDHEGIRLLEEKPIQNNGSTETLEDFLKFTRQYPADHKVLLFWNHGGGMTGFCYDEIFDDQISLPEMREAFENVYGVNPAKPVFELLGYDACLMASMEVTEYMKGYVKYLVASEESEAGDGWDHTAWMKGFLQDTSVNGAQLGKIIVDSFTEFYGNGNALLNDAYYTDATLSVIDVEKAQETAENYGILMGEAFRRSVQNPGILAELGRASRESIRFAGANYGVYNTVDLGLFMDALSEELPEAAAVRASLDDAVLYRRATDRMKTASGLTVYFPAETRDIYSVMHYLQFMNEVCEDPRIKCLYYYKLAGCLSPELKSFAEEQGYGEVKPLDLEALQTIDELDPAFDENFHFILPISEKAQQLSESCEIQLVKFNEAEEEMIYYGGDDLVERSETGGMYSRFDGNWIMLERQPLAVELINNMETVEKYRSRVLINGVEYYLLLQRDKKKDDFVITGTVEISANAAEDVIGRSENVLTPGDKITPVYEMNCVGADQNPRIQLDSYGKTIRYSEKTKIRRRALENGDYLLNMELKDPRGVGYSSKVVRVSVKDGKLTGAELAKEFYSSQY